MYMYFLNSNDLIPVLMVEDSKNINKQNHLEIV